MHGLLLSTLLAAAAHADTPVDTLPDALRTRFEEGEAAWAEGDLLAASSAFTAVIDAEPSFDRAWRRRCGVRLQLEETEGALEDCRRAVALVDGHENRTGLAIALLQSEDPAAHEEAGTLLQAVVLEHADYLPGWNAFCTWASDAQRTADMTRCAQALGELAPDTRGTLYFQSLALAEAGKLGEATETLRYAQEKGLTDAYVDAAATRIAQLATRAKAKASQRMERREEASGSWSPGDLLPLLIGGVLILTVGVIAFGADDEEEDEAPQA